jgi:hypothetical protein
MRNRPRRGTPIRRRVIRLPAIHPQAIHLLGIRLLAIHPQGIRRRHIRFRKPIPMLGSIQGMPTPMGRRLCLSGA